MDSGIGQLPTSAWLAACSVWVLNKNDYPRVVQRVLELICHYQWECRETLNRHWNSLEWDRSLVDVDPRMTTCATLLFTDRASERRDYWRVCPTGDDRVKLLPMEDAMRLALLLLREMKPTDAMPPILAWFETGLPRHKTPWRAAHDIARIWAPDLNLSELGRPLSTSSNSTLKAKLRSCLTLVLMGMIRHLQRDLSVSHSLLDGLWAQFRRLVMTGADSFEYPSGVLPSLERDQKYELRRVEGFTVLRAREVRHLIRRIEHGSDWDHDRYGITSLLMADMVNHLCWSSDEWQRLCSDGRNPDIRRTFVCRTLDEVSDADAWVLRGALGVRFSRFWQNRMRHEKGGMHGTDDLVARVFYHIGEWDWDANVTRLVNWDHHMVRASMFYGDTRSFVTVVVGPEMDLEAMSVLSYLTAVAVPSRPDQKRRHEPDMSETKYGDESVGRLELLPMFITLAQLWMSEPRCEVFASTVKAICENWWKHPNERFDRFPTLLVQLLFKLARVEEWDEQHTPRLAYVLRALIRGGVGVWIRDMEYLRKVVVRAAETSVDSSVLQRVKKRLCSTADWTKNKDRAASRGYGSRAPKGDVSGAVLLPTKVGWELCVACCVGGGLSLDDLLDSLRCWDGGDDASVPVLPTVQWSDKVCHEVLRVAPRVESGQWDRVTHRFELQYKGWLHRQLVCLAGGSATDSHLGVASTFFRTTDRSFRHLLILLHELERGVRGTVYAVPQHEVGLWHVAVAKSGSQLIGASNSMVLDSRSTVNNLAISEYLYYTATQDRVEVEQIEKLSELPTDVPPLEVRRALMRRASAKRRQSRTNMENPAAAATNKRRAHGTRSVSRLNISTTVETATSLLNSLEALASASTRVTATHERMGYGSMADLMAQAPVVPPMGSGRTSRHPRSVYNNRVKDAARELMHWGSRSCM